MAGARLAALLLLSLATATAAAQYPSRPVRLLVPNPPGGATDTLARLFAPRLSERLGQPVVVDNRPGSNGNLASETAARAAPDGHTLLLAADAQIVIGPHLYARMPLDTLRDLAPVATLVSTQMLLTVHPDLPVSTLQEFIEYARRARPPLAYASIGNGSQHHLVMEMLKARAGIDLLHVPFKGGGPATTALLGGEIAAMFGGNSVTGQVRAGKLRALAVGDAARVPSLPEYPTIAESGLAGYEAFSWAGVIAPAGTPQELVKRVNAELGQILRQKLIVEQLAAEGTIPVPDTPEEFSAYIKSELVKWAAIVRLANIKPE